jgi:cobalt-precorrin-7 (C5)-methyltransferase
MIVCIGAGPGDTGYLTRRGAEVIRAAEVVAGFRRSLEGSKRPEAVAT